VLSRAVGIYRKLSASNRAAYEQMWALSINNLAACYIELHREQTSEVSRQLFS
jgi:hypothetical protein